MPLRFWISVASLLLCADVHANDSIARVGAGGLVLEHSDQIRMASEVLTISSSKIHVQYRFINDSDDAIETTVAFPMPAYSFNPGQSAYEANNGPIDTFRMKVDNNVVRTQVERRAFLAAKDITDELHRAGLNDEKIARFYYTPEQTAELKRLGIVSGPLAGDEGAPWSVQDTVFWTQRFASHGETLVEHEYAALAGGKYTYARSDATLDLPVSSIDDVDHACLDEGSRRAIAKRVETLLKQGRQSVQVNLRDVEYVLGTGRNWKGPIGKFTLDIQKDRPDDIVSLCFPGNPQRVGDKVLRFQQESFLPPDRLQVNFYSFDSADPDKDTARGLRFDSPGVLDLAQLPSYVPGKVLIADELDATAAKEILAAPRPSDLENATQVDGFSEDPRCESEQPACEIKRLAASNGMAKRMGARLAVTGRVGRPALFVDYVIPSKDGAEGDSYRHGYFGRLRGSGYHRVRVWFGHDSPGSFLINPQNGKVAFLHDPEDVTALSPDGLHVLTTNTLNLPFSVKIAALDASGPRVELMCGPPHRDRVSEAIFKGWRNANSFDLVFKTAPSKSIALRATRIDGVWQVHASDVAALNAADIVCASPLRAMRTDGSQE